MQTTVVMKASQSCQSAVFMFGELVTDAMISVGMLVSREPVAQTRKARIGSRKGFRAISVVLGFSKRLVILIEECTETQFS